MKIGKKKYKFKLKIKGVKEKIFIQGEEPGVIATEEVTYINKNHRKSFKSSLFFAQLLRTEEDFINKHIKVIKEEIE